MTCVSTYQILKDFAGPVAAIIGATVAGTITFIFARAQTRIAASQRDIALDKLKFDLFQKRYEIYEATKSLLEHMAFVIDLETSNPARMRSLYVTLDEARFYFPPDITRLLDDIHASCERFMYHLGEREVTPIDNPKWRSLGDALAQDQAELRAFYATLPQKFEASLAFKQLTSPQ
jgi:hypothetical protein